MKPSKRKRLEAAGWRVGSATEFLDLSAEEAAYVDLKLALGQTLRRARTRRRLTQATLAKQLGSSQSRVAKMEAGDPSVSLDLQVKALLALGTDRRTLAKAVATRKVRASA
jgi:DNA-binding XRE family transcriptional regulator